MFGKRKDKLYVTLTIHDSEDIRPIRDYLIDIVFRKMPFIRHASASFGVISNNVVAEDYETTRAYENIPDEIVAENNEAGELQQMKLDLEDMQEKIDERIALN